MKNGFIYLQGLFLLFFFSLMVFIFPVKILIHTARVIKKFTVKISYFNSHCESYILTLQRLSRRLNNPCLISSLVFFVSLKEDSKIIIGVNIRPQFNAHAWVEGHKFQINMDENAVVHVLHEVN